MQGLGKLSGKSFHVDSVKNVLKNKRKYFRKGGRVQTPPPPPTLPSGKISGEGAAAHRLPKSLGINFDLDFCYTHFNWLYKKLGRFPFIRIKMNRKLSTTITNVNLQVFVGSVNKKKVHGILFLQS